MRFSSGRLGAKHCSSLPCLRPWAAIIKHLEGQHNVGVHCWRATGCWEDYEGSGHTVDSSTHVNLLWNLISVY